LKIRQQQQQQQQQQNKAGNQKPTVAAVAKAEAEHIDQATVY